MAILAGLSADGVLRDQLASPLELSISLVSIVVDTPVGTSQTRVFKFLAAGDALQWSPPEISGGLATGFCCFWYKREDNAGNSSSERLEFSENGVVNFELRTVGPGVAPIWEVGDSGGVVVGSTSAFAPNPTPGAGYEFIVIEWVAHATLGEFRLYRDGVLDVGLTNLDTIGLGVTGPNRIRFNGSAPDYFVGSVIWGSFDANHVSGQIPPLWITRHLPVADRAGNAGVGGFANINENTPDNAQVHAFSAPAQTATFFVDNLGLAGVPIHGVWFNASFERGDTVAGTQITDRHTDGTTQVVGTAQPAPAATFAKSPMYSLNPAGALWTDTDFGSGAGASSFGWDTVL